ncbi:MAG: RNA recognition motif domain-containing protein [Chthoniobacterales bacterium]
MKLYVGNLAFSATDSDLREIFSQYGTVTDASILMDRTSGRSRGFGFVTMSSQQEGEAAITALNGNEVGGRRLTVNEARPMEERAPRSGGGYGGGGGGYSGGGGGYGGGGGGRGRSDDRRGPRRDFR